MGMTRADKRKKTVGGKKEGNSIKTLGSLELKFPYFLVVEPPGEDPLSYPPKVKHLLNSIPSRGNYLAGATVLFAVTGNYSRDSH